MALNKAIEIDLEAKNNIYVKLLEEREKKIAK